MLEKTCLPWNADFIRQNHIPPFKLIEALFNVSQLNHWPNAAGLNQFSAILQNSLIPTFNDQDALDFEQTYYEQIIFQHRLIPTRSNNWHDLFNGIIWQLFPKTKSLLNQLHVADISEFGLSPRTKRRNILTHFDECGIILPYTNQDLIEMLRYHQWQDVFLTHRSAWGNQIDAFVFGHANLEMLLKPFIGLTGKWLAVLVSDEFFQWPVKQQLKHLDTALSSNVINDELFKQNKPLKPIPLLGIPNWHSGQQDIAFYQNQAYFRPALQK